MKYVIADQDGRDFASDVAENKIEEIIRLSDLLPSDRIFIIAAQLPTSFSAKVLRNSGKSETIEIESKGRVIHLLRDTDYQKGDVGVSCNPKGSEAVVNTFNVQFRDYNDDYTDRGIIWVKPGNPATIQLIITREALKTPGKVQEIIEEAKSAVANKLLDRLDLAFL